MGSFLRTIFDSQISRTKPRLISQLLITNPRIITKLWPYVTTFHCQSSLRNMSSKSDDMDSSPDVVNVTSSTVVVSVRTFSEKAGPSTDNEKATVSKSKGDFNDTRDKSPVKTQSIHTQEEIDQRKETYLSMDLDSKRNLYKSKHVTLDSIKTWPQDLSENLRQTSRVALLETERQKDVRPDLNKKISLFQGDITTLEIDAIVNAANESLLGGGGVDGAIHRAAGPHLKSECKTLHRCEPGYAKITCGYDLPAKYVIHTVGPRGENPEVLSSCYTRCLDLVREHQLTTVAFPCISTGIFGYPNFKAANVALSTIRHWLEEAEYAENVDVKAYEKLMAVYFPVDDTTDSNENKSSCSEHGESSGLKVSDENKEETETRKD